MQIGPGTRVLVTGASRGIGAAIARAFAGPRRHARARCADAAGRSRSSPRAAARRGTRRPSRATWPTPSRSPRAVARVRRRGRARGERRAHPLPARSPSSRSTRSRQMNDVNWLGTHPHRAGRAPGHDRARPRPHRDRLVRRRRARVSARRRLQRHEGRPARLRGGAPPRAARDRRVASRRSTPARSRPRSTTTSCDRMPDWYRMDRRAPAGPLGEQVVEAVEKDRRELFYPPLVRAASRRERHLTARSAT